MSISNQKVGPGSKRLPATTLDGTDSTLSPDHLANIDLLIASKDYLRGNLVDAEDVAEAAHFAMHALHAVHAAMDLITGGSLARSLDSAVRAHGSPGAHEMPLEALIELRRKSMSDQVS